MIGPIGVGLFSLGLIAVAILGVTTPKKYDAGWEEWVPDPSARRRTAILGANVFVVLGAILVLYALTGGSR